MEIYSTKCEHQKRGKVSNQYSNIPPQELKNVGKNNPKLEEMSLVIRFITTKYIVTL